MVWASESASLQCTPLGGRTYLARMPWRTRIPTAPAGACQTPPPPPPPPRDSRGAPQWLASPRPRAGRASLAA